MSVMCCYSYIVKALLSMLELLKAWSFVTLVMFLFLLKPIRIILSSLANAINKISSVKFKDLSVILQNPTVPDEAKILLTKSFIGRREEAKEALESLSMVANSFDKLIPLLKNLSSVAAFKGALDGLTNSLNSLYDALRLLTQADPMVKNKLEQVDEMIKELQATKDQDHNAVAFPSIKVLDKLDPQWVKKHPRDFAGLKEIEKLLLNILNN